MRTLKALIFILFFCNGFACIAIGIIFKNHQAEYQENFLLKERLSNLLKPVVFQRLLELEPRIEKSASIVNIAINNPLGGNKRLLLVTNPNCRNCARVHPYIKELSAHIPISLILIFNNEIGKSVSGTVISAYLQEGWEKAMQLLEEWFEKHSIKEAQKYRITDTVEQMMKEQLKFCWKENTNRTPSVIVNGHYLPEIYSFSNLRYVLT